MSSEAAYSAMTVNIMSDAKLHIFYKFTAQKKGINCPKIQNETNLSDDMLPQRSPRAQRKRLRKFCQVRIASFRLILKELIKEYGVIIIFIIIIISGSYLWLWNRHRPVAMGTVRNVQIILSCAMMVSWIT